MYSFFGGILLILIVLIAYLVFWKMSSKDHDDQSGGRFVGGIFVGFAIYQGTMMILSGGAILDAAQ